MNCSPLSIRTNNILESSFRQHDPYDEELAGALERLGYRSGWFDSFSLPLFLLTQHCGI